MRFVLLALFVAAATAAPVDIDNGEPVEVIVNGVPEGHPVEVSDIVDITLHQHANGEIQASSNLLHPYTAVGLAEIAAVEAAAAAEAAAQEIETAPVDQVVIPEDIALPEAAIPEVIIPEGIVPEVPEGIVLPEPALPEVVIPEGIALPEPATPEVVEEIPVNPEVVPLPPSPEVVEGEVAPEVAPVQLPNGEVFNDGGVQVIINTTDDVGYFEQLQSWFSLFINYFDSGVQTSHQIV